MALGNKEIMARNIQRLMDKNGVDRMKLCADLNLKYMTVADWVNAKTYPRIDKIEMLAKYFKVNKSDLVEEYNPVAYNIQPLFDQLDDERQEKVYTYAEHQLHEQQSNVVHFPKDVINEPDDIKTAYLYGTISAGTGEFVSDDEYMEEVDVKGHVPIHDIALIVNGDSMEPLFKDHEMIYIEKTKDVKSGQIGAFIINGEAFVKKLYIEDNHARLVSLNKKYDDIIVTEHDAVEVVGRVVI